LESQGSVHPECREVGFESFVNRFRISNFRPPIHEKPQITQMNADVEFGFPPAPNQTTDTATAAEGRDGARLQRQRSVFTEDAGSIVPVDQSPIIART
jgi:hypothetical protein